MDEQNNEVPSNWRPLTSAEMANRAEKQTGLKLTADELRAQIHMVQFFRVGQTTTTLCAMQMRNGFLVLGKSACIDPANFDVEIGRTVAYNDAFSKLWELEGYQLMTGVAAQHQISAAVKDAEERAAQSAD